MNVRILRSQCCGNGQCVEIAPDVFALDSKQKAIVLDESAASRETLLEAAEACPCSAIVVEDDEGEEVFAAKEGA
jgi:ferredoxin